MARAHPTAPACHRRQPPGTPSSPVLRPELNQSSLSVCPVPSEHVRSARLNPPAANRRLRPGGSSVIISSVRTRCRSPKLSKPSSPSPPRRNRRFRLTTENRSRCSTPADDGRPHRLLPPAQGRCKLAYRWSGPPISLDILPVSPTNSPSWYRALVAPAQDAGRCMVLSEPKFR